MSECEKPDRRDVLRAAVKKGSVTGLVVMSSWTAPKVVSTALAQTAATSPSQTTTTTTTTTPKPTTTPQT